jgi:hypothetical protein
MTEEPGGRLTVAPEEEASMRPWPPGKEELRELRSAAIAVIRQQQREGFMHAYAVVELDGYRWGITAREGIVELVAQGEDADYQMRLSCPASWVLTRKATGDDGD